MIFLVPVFYILLASTASQMLPPVDYKDMHPVVTDAPKDQAK